MHAPLQAHMLPGQSQGPGVPTTFVVDYHGYTLNDLRLFCQSQGLTMSGTKPHLIEDLMEHRESVDNGLRRGLFGVISLSLDCGSDFVAWALIQTPALRRGNQDNATFILHACGYEPLSTFNRTPTSFAAQLHRIIENAWTRIPLDSMSLQRVCLVEEQSLRRTFHNAIPESIQGSYDCSLLLVGLFVGIRGNQDTIVAVMNPLKVSIELELGATPEQEVSRMGVLCKFNKLFH
ncbi:hypothetical protein BCR33DRAFT_720271 [Rhizoclosmatium globosum]|uniref:SAP domain-containing protein n=1 Tax=Rhizoclosmatium globosum TaxID=329046 RepID=A0A1Y2BW72_9FUNG|nr:hypothetical protein BCR33DRAFT_720271 [Rhizoclosmatium globosum]|eukprot:ORY39001.1 hypothetical protein BCR33DRAFT_720271 [Rhizoclosmatium globosum]